MKMNKLIRGIGCIVLTCVAFACPICLTLLLAFGKAAEYGFISTILAFLTLVEFVYVATWLFTESDEDL